MLSWEHTAHKGPPRYSLYWPHWVPFKQRKGVGFFVCLFFGFYLPYVPGRFINHLT